MWRIIDISGEDYKIICSQENFVALKDSEEKLRVHFSDINSIIIHSYSINISGVLVQKLIEYNIPLIICDRAHNPCGMLIQCFKHTEYGNRIQIQINVSKPMLKKAWKQIIEAKITNQYKVLFSLNKKNEAEILKKYSNEVKSGDSTNREASASRVYFQSLFDNFKRDSESNDIINSSLNYAYAVLRSNVARAVVGAGLNPALGIFHSHKHNYFCLVDDLMEPLRPFVDFYIKENYDKIKEHNSLNSETKKILVGIIDKEFDYNGEMLNILNISQRYVMSYINYLNKNIKKILIPYL
ncbi:MAG: type II CRISPR-associated endonuclease Cas1 [Elusimicrobiota bacterium]